MESIWAELSYIKSNPLIFHIKKNLRLRTWMKWSYKVGGRKLSSFLQKPVDLLHDYTLQKFY